MRLGASLWCGMLQNSLFQHPRVVIIILKIWEIRVPSQKEQVYRSFELGIFEIFKK
jgi:hypothetical protein